MLLRPGLSVRGTNARLWVVKQDALYVIIVDRKYVCSARGDGDQVVTCGKGQSAYTLALLDVDDVLILGIRGVVDVNGQP